MKVPFNEPYMPSIALAGANQLRTLGAFYQACIGEMKHQLGFERVVLTPSCTAALELVSLALDIMPGDEIILPSYTYVSTANAFALRGAKLIFVDTYSHHPSIDLNKVEKAITKKTKAIVVVHYGGVAIDYPALKRLKRKYKIPIVEDAAHCLGSKVGNESVGSVGDFAVFSFHETKNITCGQGGAAVVNNKKYWKAANSIAQCGTDKTDFINKKVKYYSWKTIGSNYLLAEPLCAILLANLRLLSSINSKRSSLFANYYQQLTPLQQRGLVQLPPSHQGGNGHIFYLTTLSLATRDQLIQYLKQKEVEATFHYFPLHLTEYYLKTGKKRVLKNTEVFGERLVRLPLYYQLSSQQQEHVIQCIQKFYQST